MALAAILLAAAVPAHPQTPPDDACTFEICGLRISSGGMFGGRLLIAGLRNEVVLKIGPVHDRAASLLTANDSSLFLARVYDQESRKGILLRLAGAIAVGAGAALIEHDVSPVVSFGVMASGAGAFIIGHRAADRASDALSRAVWWYNREVSSSDSN